MGTLVCTIELDKTSGNGIKVTIGNKNDQITQTIQIDGTSIVMTVKKGDDEISTYTQTARSVTIKCATFEVAASETITMTSKKVSTYESSEDALTVQASKDLTLKSTTANLTATAKHITGTGEIEVSLAMGDNKLDLAAAGVSLSSSAKTSIAGGIVAVKADATLTLEATGPATLKGAITNVQGNLVNLG